MGILQFGSLSCEYSFRQGIGNLINADLILNLDAAAFAADRHRLQRCKDADASPCINHPLALADILAREGAVEDAKVIAAALLHDTVEDILTAISDDLRTSELRGLRWRDIDLAAGRITVCQRSDGFACIGFPKSPAARRTVPIPPEVVSELKRWKLRSPTARQDLAFRAVWEHRNFITTCFAACSFHSRNGQG